MKHRISSAVISISAFILIFAVAVAIPILFRPFYYWQVDAYIAEESGYDKEVIHEAYDELMDYLVFNKSFSTGSLSWSEDGKSHFKDCKVIFDVIFILGAVAAVTLIVFAVLRKKKILEPRFFGGHSLSFYLCIAFPLLLVIMLCWGLIDFDSLFVCFHALFFPGKDNWVFDPRYDQIISVLPEQFFISCAVLIGSVILIYCAVMITLDIVRKKRQKE